MESRREFSEEMGMVVMVKPRRTNLLKRLWCDWSERWRPPSTTRSSTERSVE